MTVPQKSLKGALQNALRLKCPNCGKSKVFKSYLKPIDQCLICHESFRHIRTDDAAPWLTILVVGHIVVPMAVAYEVNATWPIWVTIILWPFITISLAMLILPWAKSLFMAVIWATQTKS